MNSENRKRQGLSNLQKAKSIVSTHAFKAIFAWSKPVCGGILLLCLAGFLMSAFALGVTLCTKGLIDAATSHKSGQLIKYAVFLGILMLAERGLSVVASIARTKANATLQRTMQANLTASILGKEYAYLKPFHSGELVNRVFSDVAVVKTAY